MEEQLYLIHYGTPRHSGRYPWGSGKNVQYRDKSLREEHTIPKGTKMYRTALKDDTISGNKYVTYTQMDRDMYRGAYVPAIRKHGGEDKTADVYESIYKTKHELKVPSRDTLKSVINKVMKDDSINNEIWDIAGRQEMDRAIWKKAIAKKVMEYYGHLTYDEKMSKFQQIQIAWGKEEAQDLLKQYKDFTPDELLGRAALTFGPSKKVRAAVIEELKKMGYNAMIDEGGVGGLRPGWSKEGVAPMIIFDGEESLKNISTKKVNADTINKATKSFMKWDKKANAYDDNSNW